MRKVLQLLLAASFTLCTGLAWSAGRTISINFGSGKGSVSGEYGIVPSSSWNNFADAKQTTAVDVSVSDGTTGVTAMWWSSTVYQWTTATDNALKGYLDDGACGDGTTGTGPHIAILGIPFSYYDVIVYYATDSGSNQFNPAAFKEWTQQSKCGDTSDSYDGTMRLSRGNASLKFGKSQNLIAEVGTNVAYITRCFSFENLDIKGAPGQNSARGGIAAVQIVECDPHESEMYHNRLGGASITIPSATYGAISVDAPIKATQYTSQTTLPLTGSTTEISGDLQYVEGIGTDTRTHTIAGWFRCDGLDGEKMLYGARSHLTSAWGGYKVTVDANGAINVGQCGNWAWQGTALKSANGVIEANTWYHIAVAVTSAMPDARTATVKVFVNGTAIDFPTSTMATNLDGGSKCIEFSIGGGVSAAGLYADFSAISDAGLVQSLATNAKYVSYQGSTYRATIDQQNINFSSLVWDPSHSGSFSGTESLIVTVQDIDQTQLTFDIDPNAAELAVVSDVGVTLTKGSETTMTLSSYDFTGVSGKLTLGIPMSGVTAAYPANPNVFFDYEYTGAPPLEKGTLEYSNAALTWANNISGSWTLKVAAGDNLSIDSTSNIRPTFNVDISGGTLTFDPDGSLATAWCGSNGSTTYTQTGGEVYFKANGQSQSGSDNGVILGYTGTSATPLVLDISGGLFAVENSSINFWNAATINLTGGKVRAKGVFAGATSGTHTVNIGADAVFELGSLGWRSGSADVTLSGTLRAFENAAMANDFTYTDGAKLVAASGTYLFIQGGVTGEGTLTCGDATDDGEVVFLGDAPEGVAGTYYYGYEVTINNCGKMAIPEGKEVDKIRVFDASGKALTITGYDEKYIYFDWEITGGACWWDYEFEGNGNNSGTEGTALSWDGGRPYQGAEYVTDETTGEQSLHIPSRPWRNVSSWPTEATFVMYGTMVCSNKTYQLAFGSSTASTKNQLILATRSVADGTVDLCYSSAGGEPTVLCTMTVPNAQSANHLYAFVLKTDDNGNSVVNTYLDGELLQPYTHEGTLTLGAGFQIASGHGGVASGYSRPADNDPALLDWLRVYNLELSDEAMAEYAKRYPYVPPNGSYQRDVIGTGLWNASKAWTKEGTTTVTNVPAEGAVVKIDVDGNGGLDVNLSSDATYDTIQITGDGTFTLDRATTSSGKVRSAGRVTAKTDVVFAYDAFAMMGAPLTVADNCTVTFDMSSVELDVWSPVSYDLTGLVTTGANAKVTCTCGTIPTGRSVWYGIDPSDQHFKFVIGVDGAMVAEVTKDTTFANLEWKVNGVSVTPDWTKTVSGTISNLSEGVTLTFGESVASSDSVLTFAGTKSLSLATGTDVTVGGLTYDFTGLGAKATFKYNPDPAKVRAGYVRYDLDMGTYLYYDILLSAGGRYEFKKVRIDGNNYDYHDRTVIVQEGDYLLLHDGTNLGSGLSLDVRGGEVHIGNLEGRAAIAYGQNGTRFNQSGGTVTVHANGTSPSGTSSGFVLAHSANGGGCHEFNVTGGTFTVPDSYICFNEATNTINVSGTGVVRAKGAYSAKTTSSGVVNVSGDGAFEIGAFGCQADACALNLNGGTLRGFETGATNFCAIVLDGASKLASAADAELTMMGAVTGTGALTISGGTVRPGVASAFGTLPLAVASGATLDLNGIKIANALTISGAGVASAGALVNTGAPVAYTTSLTLAADATVGGSAAITNQQSLAINLAGHVLTVGGEDAFAYVLGHGTVTGGGGISVSSGTLSTYGQSTALEADLAIVGGKLDLSTGTSLSCQNFSYSRGTIVGTAAKLIVNGTFDASSAVSVPILQLEDASTLNGLGLTVTSALSLGSKLTVIVPTEKMAKNVKLATVPEGTTLPEKFRLILNGREDYNLSVVGSSLLASQSGGGVFADVTLGHATGWTDFREFQVDGTVKDFHGTASGQTNIHVVVASDDGVVVTQHFDYVVGEGGAFTNYVTGLEQGKSYDVSVFVTIEDAEVDAQSAVLRASTARAIDRWIDEYANTFLNPGIGTGYWSDRYSVASILSGRLRFDSETWTHAAEFEPTNSTSEVLASQVKDIHYAKITFDCPGFYTFEDDPPVVGEDLARVTLVADEDEKCAFAVASNGVWAVVPREIFAPEMGKEYEFAVRFDERASNIVYSVIHDSVAIRLAVCPLSDETAKLKLDFTGYGSVDEIVGTCYDANLAKVGTTEYWDIDAARAVAGSSKDIVPLWWSTYTPSDASGSFRIYDPNHYLTLFWRKWHHWGFSDDTYRYVSGNNWIEYADASGVQPFNGGWLVTNEVGLAWLAETATNQWIEGEVVLGADLDLASKNWTPIAQFTGVFDGRGHTITGLNNTNVVDDPLLGEAGYYFDGPTNFLGDRAYGLFASATNAAFGNIAFNDLAISNTSDSVAALLGVHAGGTLEIVNVTNASGIVWGEGRAVAGIVTVGGTSSDDIVVTGNVNRATIVGAITNDDDGGNVAQILAGAQWGTVFNGDVATTNNVGEGDFEVDLGTLSWLTLPVCNLAPAVVCTDAETNFWRFVEANDPASVPIDPVKRTARMLAGLFANGSENTAGWWMDAISASESGGEIKLSSAQATNDVWNTIVIDRDLTLDLNGTTIYGVYDSDVFRINTGVAFTIRNGKICVPQDFLAFGGDTSKLVDDVTTETITDDFLHRTAVSVDMVMSGNTLKLSIPALSVLSNDGTSYMYTLESKASLTENEWEEVAWSIDDGGYNENDGVTFDVELKDKNASGFYRVRIEELPMDGD